MMSLDCPAPVPLKRQTNAKCRICGWKNVQEASDPECFDCFESKTIEWVYEPLPFLVYAVMWQTIWSPVNRFGFPVFYVPRQVPVTVPVQGYVLKPITRWHPQPQP